MPAPVFMPATVYVMASLTNSRGLADLRVFDTLRVGFPGAVVSVIDNNSSPDGRAALAGAVTRVGGRLRRLDAPLSDYGFLSEVILDPCNVGPAAIVDPGVVFWSNCEQWTFDALIAGRVIPRFLDDSGCINMPRLHPAFWWIPDLAALRAHIRLIYQRSRLGYLDAFAPYIWRDVASGIWYRNDVGANLYGAVRERTHAFAAAELDAFDCPGVVANADAGVPRAAATLKGQWRAQDDYFRLRAVPTVPKMVLTQ